MFLGAAGTFTFDQRQIDVTFAGYAPPPQTHRRAVHVCIGRGVGFMYTEMEVINQAFWVSDPAIGCLMVVDRGPMGAPQGPPVVVQPVVVFQNGVPVYAVGFLVLFGRFQEVTRTIPGAPGFVYIPHYRPSPDVEMIPDPARNPFAFNRLLYGGQVQNWRKGVA